MSDMKQVAFCGLYCGLCSVCNRIPGQAQILRDTLIKDGIEYWGPGLPDFKPFWDFLNRTADSEKNCSCREGTCGYGQCEIRKCAKSREVDVCPFCEEYPCEHILNLAKRYVNMHGDAQRMKEIGLEKWIEEQQQRRATGFAYSDIRCETPADADTESSAD